MFSKYFRDTLFTGYVYLFYYYFAINNIACQHQVLRGYSNNNDNGLLTERFWFSGGSEMRRNMPVRWLSEAEDEISAFP